MATIRKYKTSRKNTGFMVHICTQSGQLTGYKILAPYSSPARFNIGNLAFEVRNNKFAYAMGDIPQSWFMDLNAA